MALEVSSPVASLVAFFSAATSPGILQAKRTISDAEESTDATKGGSGRMLEAQPELFGN